MRERPKCVGTATQHRVYAALRAVLTRGKHATADVQPVYAVELEPEETPEAERWSAAEASRFLAATADDPLHLLFRIAVLRGARRGELSASAGLAPTSTPGT